MHPTQPTLTALHHGVLYRIPSGLSEKKKDEEHALMILLDTGPFLDY
jgi:hypothetical protein